MHRTTGEDYVLIDEKRMYANEDLPGTPGSVMDAGAGNALQEEIAGVVEHAGLTLAATPALDTMDQLKVAIFESQKINAASIESNSITSTQIANDGVESGNIKAGAVEEDKLATGAVTNSKLGSSSVSTIKIVNGAINDDKLGTDAVTTVKIQDGAVTPEKLSGNFTPLYVVRVKLSIAQSADGTYLTNFFLTHPRSVSKVEMVYQWDSPFAGGVSHFRNTGVVDGFTIVTDTPANEDLFISHFAYTAIPGATPGISPDPIDAIFLITFHPDEPIV